MKPSDIKDIFPFDSNHRNFQYELCAQNIAKILSRTGDKFRLITEKEYIKERNKDKKSPYNSEENHYLGMRFILAEEKLVREFSRAWNIKK